MRITRIIFLFSLAIFIMSATSGCGAIQSEYYEVHLIVVDDQPFYFINPYEGKDTLSGQSLANGESLFIYLYEPSDDSEFSYEDYFTTIESHYVEENLSTGKLYLLATQELDNQITQFCIDKDAWESTRS